MADGPALSTSAGHLDPDDDDSRCALEARLNDQPTPKDLKWLRWCIQGAPIFSTCARAQYLAIVLDRFGHVLGTGYNGGPRGMRHCVDGACPRASSAVPAGTPYGYGPGLCIAIHAEANALLHSDFTARSGGTIYVNGPPCFDCAKLIANSGVARCVHLANEGRLDHAASVWIMREAGVTPVTVWPHEIGVEPRPSAR